MGSALGRILGFAEGTVDAVERVLLSGGELSRRPLTATHRERGARRFHILEVVEPTGELSWFAERVKVSLG